MMIVMIELSVIVLFTVCQRSGECEVLVPRVCVLKFLMFANQQSKTQKFQFINLQNRENKQMLKFGKFKL